MLALGLASFQFFSYIHERWTEVNVDLPQVRSETPIFITPQLYVTKEILYKRSFISKERDLSSFVNGGEFTNRCFTRLEEKGCGDDRVKIRQFLYKHWKNKQRATFSYYWIGADVEGKSHFFIQPDENGKWKIIAVSEMYGLENYGMDNLEMRIYDSVKYKLAKKDDYSFEAGTKYLSLIDETGEENYAL